MTVLISNNNLKNVFQLISSQSILYCGINSTLTIAQFATLFTEGEFHLSYFSLKLKFCINAYISKLSTN